MQVPNTENTCRTLVELILRAAGKARGLHSG